MKHTGLYLRIVTIALILLALTACDVPVNWNGDIRTYVDDGLSSVFLKAYTLRNGDGDILTAAPSSEENWVSLSLINPREVPLSGTVSCDQANLLAVAPALSDTSGITRELSFSFTPDLGAEHSSLSFSLSLTAPSTGAAYTLDIITIPCNSVPGSMENRVCADTDSSNRAFVSFALPGDSTDDDISSVTISWENLADSSDRGTESYEAGDTAIMSAIYSDTGTDLAGGYDASLRRYYQPGSLTAGDDYQFQVSVKDSGGLTSQPGSAVSNANYFLLSYDGNSADAGSAPADQYFAQGKTVTLPGNTGNLSRSGYVFIGWNTDYDGSGTSFSGGDSFTMGGAALTLYAEWTAVHSVAYDANDSTSSYGGTIPAASTTYFENDTVTVLGNTGPLYRSGYAFAGWNTASDGTGTSYRGGDAFSMGTGDITLYAVWDEIAALAAGSRHSLLLTAGGLVFGAGSNTEGQLGQGVSGYATEFTMIDSCSDGAMPVIDQIYAGYDCSFLVDISGNLYVSGDNGSGQLGLGSTSTSDVTQFTRVSSLSDGVVKAAIGSNFAMIITDDGTDTKLFSSGDNSYGQLGLGTTASRDTFAQVTLFSDGASTSSTPGTIMADVAAGELHSLIRDGNGDLYSCGSNAYWQCGIDPSLSYFATQYTLPTFTSLGDVVGLSAGANHSRIVTHPTTYSYYLYGSGYNPDFQTGVETTYNNGSACIEQFTKSNTSSSKYLLYAAADHSLYISSSSKKLYAFGAPDSYSIGSSTAVTNSLTEMADNASDVGAGAEHTLVLTSGGLYGVGSNREGQLGTGTASSAETSLVEIFVK